MARSVLRAADHYGRRDIAQAMLDWAGEPSTDATKKKRSGSWNRAIVQEEVAGFIATRDWTRAAPRHFVELYARLHTEMYGVEPLELKTARVRMGAAGAAARTLREMFDGDPAALADFMRWVWIGQALDEKRRRSGTGAARDFRVTWRYQWAATLVTNYRRSELTAKVER